jgi:hypothetical protein
LHRNLGEDISTVHDRELRQSPETNAFPATEFSSLFEKMTANGPASTLASARQI